jgi:tetratricopeptide (TPR) repeat protein
LNDDPRQRRLRTIWHRLGVGMMRRNGAGMAVWSLVALFTLAPGDARAIMSGEASALVPSGDSDYAAGKAAFLAENWQLAIANLTMVVLRRPWHDNAHNMLGYSWRKLANYDLSLEHYQAALTLNPRHKGALAYLGEAYLDLGRIDDANATFQRLAKVCGFVVMGFDNNGWRFGCEELEALAAAYAERGVALPAS